MMPTDAEITAMVSRADSRQLALILQKVADRLRPLPAERNTSKDPSDLIERARAVANPRQRDFVESIGEFYKQRGFISAKQRASLEAIVVLPSQGPTRFEGFEDTPPPALELEREWIHCSCTPKAMDIECPIGRILGNHTVGQSIQAES